MHGGRLQARWDPSKVDGRLLLARCDLEEALGRASIYTKVLKAMDALQLDLDGSVPPFARIAEVRCLTVLALTVRCATSMPVTCVIYEQCKIACVRALGTGDALDFAVTGRPQEPAELQPEEHARVCTAFESKLLRDQEEATRKRGAQRGNQQEAAGPSGPRAPGQARALPPRQGS